MTGHLQIIEFRKQRLKPSAIFFTDAEPLKSKIDFEAPERALEHGLYPEVYLTSHDLKKRLDLRFVAGCKVLINTKELTGELLTVAERAVDCGATSVCVSSRDDLVLFHKGEWQAWTY